MAAETTFKVELLRCTQRGCGCLALSLVASGRRITSGCGGPWNVEHTFGVELNAKDLAALGLLPAPPPQETTCKHCGLAHPWCRNPDHVYGCDCGSRYCAPPPQETRGAGFACAACGERFFTDPGPEGHFYAGRGLGGQPVQIQCGPIAPAPPRESEERK